jgi:hypothetical protein
MGFLSDDGNLTIHQQMSSSSMHHLTGSRVIIDDIMLRSTSISLLMLLLECYLRIYLKYRITLNLKKCNFFKKGSNLLDMISCPWEILRPSQNMIS